MDFLERRWSSSNFSGVEGRQRAKKRSELLWRDGTCSLTIDRWQRTIVRRWSLRRCLAEVDCLHTFHRSGQFILRSNRFERRAELVVCRRRPIGQARKLSLELLLLSLWTCWLNRRTSRNTSTHRRNRADHWIGKKNRVGKSDERLSNLLHVGWKFAESTGRRSSCASNWLCPFANRVSF